MALTTNIVSYWKFDNNGTDSVSSHSADISAVTYTSSGKINGAYSGDGTSDEYITVDHHTDYSPDYFSISCWIKYNTVDTNVHAIWQKNGGTTATQSFYLSSHRASSRGIWIGVRNTSSSQGYQFSNVYPVAGTWYHVVVTYDGSNVKLYVNNSLTNNATGNLSGTLDTNTTDMTMLGTYSNTQLSDAVIDECGFWSRALTSTEVGELYNSGDGLTYPFTTGVNMKVNIGDSWKSVVAIKINVGDSWKDVTAIKQNIGDTWKTV